MKEKQIEIWLIEVFNDNDNAWEWDQIERKTAMSEEHARKKAYAYSYGIEYDTKTDKFIGGDGDDKEYVQKNWEENTRAWGLTI